MHRLPADHFVSGGEVIYGYGRQKWDWMEELKSLLSPQFIPDTSPDFNKGVTSRALLIK
jgi:hypothetical protein